MENNVNKKAVVVLATLAVLASASAYYFWQQTNALKMNPQETAQADVQSLLATVSKLIVLPQGETPTVATVVSTDQLKDQPFFVNANKGDKLLIFTGAKEAFLYNPDQNRIINVAPINLGADQSQQPAISQATTTQATTTATTAAKAKKKSSK